MHSQALVQAQQLSRQQPQWDGWSGWELRVSDCQSSTECVALLFSSIYVVQHSKKPELLYLTAETCKLCNLSPSVAHGTSRDPLRHKSRETLLHPSWAENSHKASTSQSFLGSGFSYGLSYNNYDRVVNVHLSIYATRFFTCREVKETVKAPKADAICYISTISFNEQNGAKHIL